MGNHATCRTFGGTKENKKHPLAWIDVEPPFLSKKVIAAVLLDPCASLILGYIEGIKDHSEVEI